MPVSADASGGAALPDNSPERQDSESAFRRELREPGCEGPAKARTAKTGTVARTVPVYLIPYSPFQQ